MKTRETRRASFVPSLARQADYFGPDIWRFSDRSSEVEAAIQEQLDSLMRGRTVIAIAHRLSTIARMDRLVVLEQGRIVEEGTHAQLLARGGTYARLWRRQSGGFTDVDAAIPIDAADAAE